MRVSLLVLCLCACEAARSSAKVSLDLSAVSALSAGAAQITITLTCDNGDSIAQAVPANAQSTFSATFPACGAGTIAVSATATADSDAVVALYGEAPVTLHANQDVRVTIQAYVTGEVEAALADGVADCMLVFKRIRPVSDDITRSVAMSGINGVRVRLPVGDYTYACAANLSGALSISAGQREKLAITGGTPSATSGGNGSSSGSGSTTLPPDLISDTFPKAATAGPITFTAVFSEPVTGDASGAIMISGTFPLPQPLSATSVDRLSWTFTIGGFQDGGEYDVGLTNAIHSDATLRSLAGAPLVRHLSLLAKNHFYVLVSGSDTADGLTPATAFASPSHAVSIAATSGTADVLVATGDYTDNIALHDNVRLLGGWTSDFHSRTLAPWSHISNTTAASYPVDGGPGLGRSAVLDRFFVEQLADAVTVVNLSGDETVSNCYLSFNSSSSGGTVTSAVEVNSGNPLIVNNIMYGGKSGTGTQTHTGVAVFQGTAEIVNNTIDAGIGGAEVDGIHLYQPSATPIITNNLIVTSGGAAGVGIRIDNSNGGTSSTTGMPLSVQNNLFAFELAQSALVIGTGLHSGTFTVAQGNFSLDGTVENAHSVRYEGNIASAQTSATLINESATHDQPGNDDGLLQPDLALFGKPVGSADCGPHDAPRACLVPSTDYLQNVRGSLLHVGAREN